MTPQNKQLLVVFLIGAVLAILAPSLVNIPMVNSKNQKPVSSDLGAVSITKSSREYAVMGLEIWSAFECSAWASTMGDTKEAERLFLIGYKQGKEFIGALKSEKIKEDDMKQEVPIGISWVLQGPSEEFILGRIFDSAQEEALDKVLYSNYDRAKMNSEELQKTLAENEFRNGNCRLIGK